MDINDLNNESYDASGKERDAIRDKIKGINDKISQMRKDNRDAEKNIRKKYQRKILEAGVSSTRGGASSLGWMQFTFWAKLILDFAKIFACFLVVTTTMHIVSDEESNPSLRNCRSFCPSFPT